MTKAEILARQQPSEAVLAELIGHRNDVARLIESITALAADSSDPGLIIARSHWLHWLAGKA